MRTVPELLGKLVGQQNAMQGADRLFVTLQHHALNKNLFYVSSPELYVMGIFGVLIAVW